MLRLPFFIVALFVTFAAAARADLVSPDQEACFDKKGGDACTTCVSAVDSATCGTCVAPPPSCQAGACRRFGDQAACLAEPGCSWESGRPVCSGAPCACNKTDEKPSACASGAPLSFGSLAVVLSLALLRRRK